MEQNGGNGHLDGERVDEVDAADAFVLDHLRNRDERNLDREPWSQSYDRELQRQLFKNLQRNY
jgi:hypothetical protein